VQVTGDEGRSSGSDVRPKVLQSNRAEFQRCFGSAAFALRHRLAGNPLFSLVALEDAAASWMKLNRHDRFVVVGGQTRADAKFSEMAEQDRIAGAITALPNSGSYIKISNINAVNPAYDNLMHEALRDAQDLLGQPLLTRVTWAQMTVFMASPNIVTPYHIDHEANFLCQISGEKEVCLFDPNDREVLTDSEIEKFYLGDLNGACYRKQLQHRGTIFHLSAGDAVHHPPLSPHWVKNGPSVSISVSINFCMRELDRLAHIYQVNCIMRRIGFRPSPPGRSFLRDAIKAGGMGLISTSKPKSYHDTLFSGLDRLRAPYRMVGQLIGRQSRDRHAK
jgi:Cupin-like domain